MGTLLPAAVRGLETCQFLRWPNTEGLISSKCSLSLSLSVCVCVCVRERERVSGKTTQREEGEFACVLERKRMK